MARHGESGHIPADLSSFVDRREELSDVRRLVAESRMVTVTGTPGVGKSRLARRAAQAHGRAFRDGVYLVELGEVTDEALVPEAVASTLGIPERSGRDAETAVIDFVAGRHMLLLLENCSHVAEAVTMLVAELLRAAPDLHVLATSREVLGIAGEITYRLDPLPLPDDAEPQAVAVNPAVALFLERAASVVPGFTPHETELPAVVDICRRLEGIPLALELAASQLRVLSVADLDARLDDRLEILTARRGTGTPRHRTLRAAVEWSYDLCEKPERQLWQRLSVFAGEFDLTDAEEVCADESLERLKIIEAMRGLVDKSVVSIRIHDGAHRFRLLDTLRRYGLDRLAADAANGAVDERELRARHLHWYADLSCQFEANWFGPDQSAWLRRMRTKLPDIRAALKFAADHPEHVRDGLRMAAALCWFWGTTAAVREGHTWLVRLLDEGTEPTQERSRALSTLTILMITVGATDGCVEVAREALEIAQREDPDRLPRVHHNLGMALATQGSPDGMPLLEKALALCRERQLRGEELAYATYTLGYGKGLTGHPEEAAALFDESVAVCREAGDVWWRGVVQVVAAFVAWANGDSTGAADNALDGLRACRLIPDLNACAIGLTIVALILVERDDCKAAHLLGAAEGYWSDAGGSFLQGPVWADRVAAAKAQCRANLGPAAFDAEYQAGQREPTDAAAALALDDTSVPEHPSRAAVDATQDPVGLTRREREVAALLAEGLSNRDIAARLVISPRTAETHVQNMLIKTGFTTRSQLAVWYATTMSE